MKNKLQYITLILFTFLFSIMNIRCESVIQALFNGLLGGTVNSGNGSLALGDATVTQSTGDGDANSLIVIDSTTTDANGHYQFTNVTTGSKILIFRKGVFADTMFLNIQNDQIYEGVNSYLNKIDGNKKFGYLYGERDSIQSVVQGLGYNIDLLPISSFGNYNILKNYEILFINSGSQAISSQFLGNANVISQFIDSGGKVYSSDWAIQLLLQLNLGLQGVSDFEGDIQSITSTVLDSNLRFFISSNTALIKYNSNSWNSLNTIFFPRNFNFYTEGTYTIDSGGATISNQSLSFSTEVGQMGGKVIYTTFRKEPNIPADMIKILQFYIYDL